MKCALAGAAFVIAGALPAAAQRSVEQAGDSTAHPSPAACDSMMRSATVDSVSSVVTAYLVRTDGGVMSQNMADLLLQEFALQFHVPQPLRVPLLAPGPASLAALSPDLRGGPAPRELRIQGIYDFTALGNGGAKDIRVRLTSLAADFDSAVVATLAALAHDGAMPTVAGQRSDTIPLRLGITSGPPQPGRARALFRASLPRMRAMDAAEADGAPQPPYPTAERALGMDGYVLFQLVVGRDGRVEPGTVEILQATSVPFMQAAIPLLDSLHFKPAMVGACPVPQVYQLPMRFVAPPTVPTVASPAH